MKKKTPAVKEMMKPDPKAVKGGKAAKQVLPVAKEFLKKKMKGAK